MSDTNVVDQAIKRLTGALDALDAVIERRLEKDRQRGTLDEQVHAFSADRARLASELDGAAARARELETTNREAARRLDEAMTTIRAVIAENQRQGHDPERMLK
jgi:L-lactate utilization protein LutB